jgi:hypothetical protein
MCVQYLLEVILSPVQNTVGSRDSSVSIATGYGLGGRVILVRFPAGPRNVSLIHSILSNGYLGSFPSAKWYGREADHSPPSSAHAKNSGAIPPLHLTSSWLGA